MPDLVKTGRWRPANKAASGASQGLPGVVKPGAASTRTVSGPVAVTDAGTGSPGLSAAQVLLYVFPLAVTPRKPGVPVPSGGPIFSARRKWGKRRVKGAAAPLKAPED